jgi:hypothetical protein
MLIFFANFRNVPVCDKILIKFKRKQTSNAVPKKHAEDATCTSLKYKRVKQITFFEKSFENLMTTIDLHKDAMDEHEKKVASHEKKVSEFEVTLKNTHKTNIRIIFGFFILRKKQQNYRMTLKLTTPIFKNIKKQLTNMKVK